MCFPSLLLLLLFLAYLALTLFGFNRKCSAAISRFVFLQDYSVSFPCGLILNFYCQFHLLPGRCHCYDVKVGFAWSNDPESYANGSVATGRISNDEQKKVMVQTKK